MEPLDLRIKKPIENIEYRKLPVEFSIDLPKRNVPPIPSIKKICKFVNSDESFREVEIILNLSKYEISKKFLEQHHLSIRKLIIQDRDGILSSRKDYIWKRIFNKISILPSEMPNLDTLEIRNKYLQNQRICFRCRLPALKKIIIDRLSSQKFSVNLDDFNRVIDMFSLSKALFTDNDSHEDYKDWCEITIFYDDSFVTKYIVHFLSSISCELCLVVLRITFENYQKYVAPRVTEYIDLLKLIIDCYGHPDEYFAYNSIGQIPRLSILHFIWHTEDLSAANASLFEIRFGTEIKFPSSLRHLNIGQFFNTMIAKKISESCPNLESLNVSGSKNLTEEAFLCVIKHLPNLQFLSLSKLESSINDYWHHFEETDLPNLIFLNLYGTVIPESIFAMIRLTRPTLVIREPQYPGTINWDVDNVEGFACTNGVE